MEQMLHVTTVTFKENQSEEVPGGGLCHQRIHAPCSEALLKTKRKSRAILVLLLAVLAAGMVFRAVTKTTTAPSDAPGLIGTWRLVAFEDHAAGEMVKHPYGKTPVGLLIYDATGHMSIQVAKLPHPQVASGNDEKITDAEKLALFDAYESYFGSYTVDWRGHIVTHHVDGDLRDVFRGTDQPRPFELDGDHLSLVPVWIREDGVRVRGVRKFERVH
jgi:hypothetical protein